MYNCVLYFCTYPYGLSLNGWHGLLCIVNNRHGVTITTHAIQRHFLIWMTTVRLYALFCIVNSRHGVTITTHAIKRHFRIWMTTVYGRLLTYLWLMGDKMIPDSAEPRLELFYPPFVAGIDLPHQGVVDSYNLTIKQDGVTANDKFKVLIFLMVWNRQKAKVFYIMFQFSNIYMHQYDRRVCGKNRFHLYINLHSTDFPIHHTKTDTTWFPGRSYFHKHHIIWNCA